MRLTGIEIEGFGGVAERLSLDLDANVVILTGPNGLGKTTVCDAIIWGITGVHPRGANPQNLYSSRPARVAVIGQDASGSRWTITRVLRERNLQTHVKAESTSLEGAEATSWIVRSLAPRADLTSFESAAELLSDSVYMQQDTLRSFLNSRTDDERFSSLSQMVGARRLSEFDQALDAERRRWSKSVKREESELLEERQRLEDKRSKINAQRSQIAQISARSHIDTWELWVDSVQRLLGEEFAVSTISEKAIGKAVDGLNRFEARLSVTRSTLDVLGSEVSEAQPRLPRKVAQLPQLKVALDTAIAEHAESEALLQATERIVVAAREDAHRREAFSRQMAELASLADGLLTDHCPVCNQRIEASEVRQRLAGLQDHQPGTPVELRKALEAAAEARAATTRRYAAMRAAEVAVADAQEEEHRHLIDVDSRRRLLDQLGIEDTPHASTEIRRLHSQIQEQYSELQRLRASAVYLRDLLEVNELRMRLDASLSQLGQEDDALAERGALVDSERRTAMFADVLSRSLKNITDDLVSSRITDVQPLMDHIYAAIDPHPTFKSVRFNTRVHYGKQRLDPVVADDDFGVEVDDPGRTLSTSQANALAVAMFLSFSLGLSPTRLATLILDDPLQNLDDIHLLGLVDALRQVRKTRQLIITTHDLAFARLMARKLRAVSRDESLVVHSIEGWDRKGPVLRSRRTDGKGTPLVFISHG